MKNSLTTHPLQGICLMLMALLLSCSLPGDDQNAVLPDFGSGNISISQLRNQPINTPIQEDVAIMISVVSDISAGNLPEGVVFVQDNSMRGICMSVSDPSKYAFSDFLSINLNGAALTTNQDGMLILEGVDESQIVKLGTKAPKPISVKANELSMYESMLVCVDQSQVTTSDSGKEFAGKKNFETIYGRRFVVYTYPTSKFATTKVPTGYGHIDGVVSTVGGKKVLLPINTDAYANLSEPRCTPPVPTFTISDVRDLDPGIVLDDINLSATVVSSTADGNFASTVAYAQDIEKGIRLEFSTAHQMSMGQRFSINIKNATIDNGTPFKLTGLDPLKITLDGNPTEVSPINISLSQLGDATYESMCVKVSGIQVTSADMNKTFGQGVNFEDANGDKLKLVTAAGSSRYALKIPAASGAITGVATATGENKELTPRSNDDFNIKGKGTRLDGKEVLFFVPNDNKDLMISEIVHGVAADGTQATAIELYNPKSTPIDLNNYMIVLLFHDSNKDIITSVAKQTLDNSTDFPRSLASGESLVIISTVAAAASQFDVSKYPYYVAYDAGTVKILGSKGNSPFILMKNSGTSASPIWTEIDRVGVPNALDETVLKSGETGIDNFSGSYSKNPSATSKFDRGWNRGRTWVRNPGENAKPGNVNLLTEETLNRTSWSITYQRAQYKADIANTACDPRNGGWVAVSSNTATSIGSAKVNTTLGWHEYSIPLAAQ